MADANKPTTFVSRDILWVYITAGAFILAALLRFIWSDGGFMVEEFAYQRWLTVFVAIIFGFGLGWLFYPRRLRWPF